jgi:hypothetical protein
LGKNERVRVTGRELLANIRMKTWGFVSRTDSVMDNGCRCLDLAAAFPTMLFNTAARNTGNRDV